jgi:zinc and cadmium transporter
MTPLFYILGANLFVSLGSLVGVLLYAGFSRQKALLANFFVALTAVLGRLIGYYASFPLAAFLPYLLPFAAGGFIYIAATDLVPEMRKEKNLKRSRLLLATFFAGVMLIFLAKLFLPEPKN